MSDKKQYRFGFSVFYRACWCFMAVLGLTWGIVVGAGPRVGWMSPEASATGIMCFLVLVATLFIAGRRSS